MTGKGNLTTIIKIHKHSLKRFDSVIPTTPYVEKENLDQSCTVYECSRIQIQKCK